MDEDVPDSKEEITCRRVHFFLETISSSAAATEVHQNSYNLSLGQIIAIICPKSTACRSRQLVCMSNVLYTSTTASYLTSERILF